MLILQMILGLAAAAQAGPAAAAAEPEALAAAKSAAAEQAKIAAEHCKARQFEAVVTLEVEGKSRRSRIRMCGREGQSDAQWIRTLQDGADKIAANPKMPQSAKEQALAAIKAEIDKLTPKAPVTSLGDAGGYSILPPLAPPPAKAEQAPLAAYSALPPIEPKTAAPATVAAAASLSPPAPVVKLTMPRISVECLTPGDLGSGGECLTIERDTLITIRARESLPAGTGLRFLRRGEMRAEVALAQMTKGQARRLKLPIDVCAGGGGGRLDVEITRRSSAATSPPQVVGALGRFELRC